MYTIKIIHDIRLDKNYLGTTLVSSARFCKRKVSTFPTDRSTALPLLQLFVCGLQFRMWRLRCPYVFLTFPFFDASGGLCFVIVTFPGYLHLYLHLKCVLKTKDNMKTKNTITKSKIKDPVLLSLFIKVM